MSVNSTVSSQLFHLPLTLDMDGCGWSGTHLSDSLSLTYSHCFFFLTRHLTHTFGLSHQWAVVQVDTFLRFSFMLHLELHRRLSVQSNASCFHWLVTLPWLLTGYKVKSAAIVFSWRKKTNPRILWGIPGTRTQEYYNSQFSCMTLVYDESCGKLGNTSQLIHKC